MPCPFAAALGEPGKGVHAARLFGLAQNDMIATIVAAILTSYIWPSIPLWKSLTAWFAAGEALHYAFGVQTAALTALGIRVPDCEE